MTPITMEIAQQKIISAGKVQDEIKAAQFVLNELKQEISKYFEHRNIKKLSTPTWVMTKSVTEMYTKDIVKDMEEKDPETYSKVAALDAQIETLKRERAVLLETSTTEPEYIERMTLKPVTVRVK